MSVANLIFEKAKALPDPLQSEALHYLGYLESLAREDLEARQWARFSSEQLGRFYSDADSIYDEEE